MNRKIVAVIALSSLIVSSVIQYHVDASWSQYPIMISIILCGVVMFVQSGNDSNWAIEKGITRLFKRKKVRG